MFGLRDIGMKLLSDHQLWIWLSLFVLLSLTVWLYRRTNPPLPLWKRLLLAGLRTVAIAALILVLLEPVLTLTGTTERRRHVVVALDASTSMERVEEGKSRRARLDSLLSGPTFDRLVRETDAQIRFFGGNVAEKRGDVRTEATALGDALYELNSTSAENPPDYYLVMSDGRSNSGRAPRDVAGRLGGPVTTVGMQVAGGGFDIGLSRVEFDPVVFVGRSSEVLAKLTWRNAAGRRATVQLLDAGRVLVEEALPLDVEGGFGDVTLRYTPESPGQKMLQVRVVPEEGEDSEDNNSRTLAVKVLKSKLLVAIVSAHPDYETGFLKRFLEQSDKYEVDLLATGGRAGNLARRFPSSQSELNRYDLVILQDPDPGELSGRQVVLESYLSEKGGAVWVMMGETFATSGAAEWFDRLLPFHPTRRPAIRRGDFQAEPDEANLFHPAVRLADTRGAIRSAWAALPPFRSLVMCDAVDPRATVLATAPERIGAGSALPVLGFKRHGPGKMLASAALPFWQWGFLNLGYGEDASTYGRFVDGTAGWLTVRDDFDPIRVAPEKEVFTRGEVIRFDGYAFDPGFRPIPNVSGRVTLTDENGAARYEADLLPSAEGRYAAEFAAAAPGKYGYRAVLEKDGDRLKENTGTILVESFSLEEFDQSADPAAMAAIASLSGGSHHSFRDFDAAVESMDLSPRVVEERREMGFFNAFWLVAVFVGALCAEWLLRKMSQLV